MSKARFNTLTVSDVRHETDDTVSIRFDVPPALADVYQFQPGQYVTVRTDLDGEDIRRSYSICAGVPEGELRIAVKAVADGRFSTYANTRLKPGDVLDVMAPMGRFTTAIEPEKEKSYVLFAAGSGITPVISIIKTVLELEPHSDVTLFYGNRRTPSIIFREEIEDLKNRYMGRLRVFHVLSRESQDVDLLYGRLDRAKVDALLDSFVDVEDIDHFFICGPEAMITDTRAALEARGVPGQHIHFELFTTPGQGKDAAAQAAERRAASGENTRVTVILDGMRTEFDMDRAETVLDAGHEAGLDLPFACKGGVCATCRCKVIEGEAKMDTNYGLEADEVAAGHVLSCQARPTSDHLVVDFDAD